MILQLLADGVGGARLLAKTKGAGGESWLGSVRGIGVGALTHCAKSSPTTISAISKPNTDSLKQNNQPLRCGFWPGVLRACMKN